MVEPPVSPGPPRIGAILPIRDMLTDVTVESLKRRIEEARAAGAKVIVFELDTPGGLVTSAIAIADLIKQLTDVKTVAWVNPNAHSGGAMVAVACEEIVMARSSRIGDSQVIFGGPQGVQAVPEDLQPKAYTPVVAEFKASATLRGYSPVLAEAFVIPEREVWWLENTETGERDFFFREEKIRRAGDVHDDPWSTPAVRPWKPVEKYYDLLLDREVPLVQPIVRSDQLLEMSPSLAYAYGFSRGIVTGESELKDRYQLSSIQRFEPSWSEALAFWLTLPYVRAFLMIVIMLGAYVEFHTPGVGLAGLVALIALAIFIGAPYLTGLAGIWEILFVVAGIVLILVELLVLPGFGVAGITGIVLLLIGLLASFAPPEPGRSFPIYFPSMKDTIDGLKQGVAVMASSMVISFAGMVTLSRYLPKIPYLKRIVPENPTPSEVLVDDPYYGAARIGDLGESVGPLRPAGKARFGSLLVDVVSEGDFISAQTPVEVVERRGNRVVVRPWSRG